MVPLGGQQKRGEARLDALAQERPLPSLHHTMQLWHMALCVAIVPGILAT